MNIPINNILTQYWRYTLHLLSKYDQYNKLKV